MTPRHGMWYVGRPVPGWADPCQGGQGLTSHKREHKFIFCFLKQLHWQVPAGASMWTCLVSCYCLHACGVPCLLLPACMWGVLRLLLPMCMWVVRDCA